jgi:hypothetical protein
LNVKLHFNLIVATNGAHGGFRQSSLERGVWDASFSVVAARTGLFAEGRFLGKVLDEWAIDAQEFIRLKLPHLLMVALIAFLSAACCI